MNPTPRKLEIITIASALFKDRGFSAVTMRDIAKAMGIKAASLYNHIKNKEEILTFIIISLSLRIPYAKATSPLSKVSKVEVIL